MSKYFRSQVVVKAPLLSSKRHNLTQPTRQIKNFLPCPVCASIVESANEIRPPRGCCQRLNDDVALVLDNANAVNAHQSVSR